MLKMNENYGPPPFKISRYATGPMVLPFHLTVLIKIILSRLTDTVKH